MYDAGGSSVDVDGARLGSWVQTQKISKIKNRTRARNKTQKFDDPPGPVCALRDQVQVNVNVNLLVNINSRQVAAAKRRFSKDRDCGGHVSWVELGCN